MSIEQLKKKLESEIEQNSIKHALRFDKTKNPDFNKDETSIGAFMYTAFRLGSFDQKNRLLLLLEKAVLVLNFYADQNNWGADHNTMENRWVYSLINENDLDQELNGGRRAREFLAEIKKESVE